MSYRVFKAKLRYGLVKTWGRKCATELPTCLKLDSATGESTRSMDSTRPRSSSGSKLESPSGGMLSTAKVPGNSTRGSAGPYGGESTAEPLEELLPNLTGSLPCGSPSTSLNGDLPLRSREILHFC